MLNAVYAIITAAIVAACIVVFPSLSPQVEASAPSLNGKADRADTRPLAIECSQRAWPYYEASCLRDARRPLGQARDVRLVVPDHVRRPVGHSALATR